MAIHTTFESFSKKMTLIADGILENAEETMIKASLAADQVLAMGTPVDTGRARGSWTASIAVFAPIADIDRGFPGTLEERKVAAAQFALDQGIGVISGYKLGTGSIFITNEVFYIELLDQGFSPQASDGMTNEAVDVAHVIIQQAKLL